jgi:hypothetical protein
MLKKITLAITSIVALFAIGSPTASAEWYDNGVALSAGENPTLETTGTFAFTSSGGGVHCNTATATIQLTGGTSFGHDQVFTVEEPSKCEVSGGLVFLTGGTTTVTSLTSTEWEKGSALTWGSGKIGWCKWKKHIKFKNGFELTLSSIESSPLDTTPNNTTSISSLALSGELNSTLAAGKVKVSGSFSVLAPNAGTYGLVS